MNKKLSNVRQLFSEIRWLVLASSWLAGLALGYLGLARFSSENALSWTFGDILYRTIQLGILESFFNCSHI